LLQDKSLLSGEKLSKTVLYSAAFVSRQAGGYVHLSIYYFSAVPESGALDHDTLEVDLYGSPSVWPSGKRTLQQFFFN